MTATAFLSSTTQPNPEMIVYDQAGLALYNENGFVFDSKIYITASSFTDITKLGDLDSRHLMLIFEWRTPETLTNLQRWSVAFKLKVLQENKDLLLPQWYRLKIDPNVLLNSPSFVFFSTKFPFNNKLESLQLGWMKVLVYQSNPPSYMYLDIDAPVHFDIIDSVKFVNGLPQNAPQARIELRKPSEPEEVETFVPQGPPPNSQGEAVQDEVVDVEQEVGGETEQEEKGKGRRPKVDTKETLDKEDEKKDNVGPRKGNGPGGKNGPRKKEDPQKENERGEAEQEGKGGSKGNPKATQDKEDVKKEKVGPQNENEPGEESGTLESSGTSEATQSSPPCIIHLQCVTRLCCMQGALDSSTSNFQDEVKSETKKEMKKPKEVQSIVSEQNQEEPNSGSTCSFSFVLLVVSLVFEFVFW
ncbi:hypothetical protein HMI56_003804 [Coelomomyces lativittatus]|nr:hypothetical protein HMI56_003804 [Coelomomyces lativittatus]